MTEKFSVAMSVYKNDKPEWFEIAANSILNQTFKPSEIVLVVDGPVPEELSKVINSYSDNGIFKIIWLPVNQGHGNARRISLGNTSNELIALMDADDIALPNRFEQQIKYFEANSNIDIVGGNITEFIGEPNNIIGKRIVPDNDQEIKSYLQKRCPFNQVTVMFKKSSVIKAGGYLDWYCDEDYYLWVRMFLNNSIFANTGTVLVNVRVGKDMYARRGGIKYFQSEARLQRFMYKKNVIDLPRAALNIAQRFILQVLLPNWLRAIVFKTLARTK